VPPAESMILSAPFDHATRYYANSSAMGGYEKNNNQQY
jgi:hypothetical protein